MIRCRMLSMANSFVPIFLCLFAAFKDGYSVAAAENTSTDPVKQTEDESKVLQQAADVGIILTQDQTHTAEQEEQHPGSFADSERKIPYDIYGTPPAVTIYEPPPFHVPDPIVEKQILANIISKEFGGIDDRYFSEMWYLYTDRVAQGEFERNLPRTLQVPEFTSGFQSQAEIDQHLFKIQRDGGVQSEVLSRVEELANVYVERQAEIHEREAFVGYGNLERQRFDSLLSTEFGPPGNRYVDEMWYKFASEIDKATAVREIPMNFLVPEIPPEFKTSMELEEHLIKVSREGTTEAQMFQRVEELAVRYMDDAIVDFEFRRAPPDMKKKRALFVTTLHNEFGPIVERVDRIMWYSYRSTIFREERRMRLKPSIAKPILPAGFDDERNYQYRMLQVLRDNGVDTNIVRRVDALAAAYLESVSSKATPHSGSCEGRCYGKYDSSHAGCHCNKECTQHGDCCPDYAELCSNMQYCKGRCFTDFDELMPCQCNDKCIEKRNCCIDFRGHCLTSISEAKNIEIKLLLENNKAYEDLVEEFETGYPRVDTYPLERRFYPQCSAYGMTGCNGGKLDYMLLNELKEFKNLLKLLWIRIMTATNDDLLVSSEATGAISRAWVDGWGPESFGIIHDALREVTAKHPDTIFYQQPGYYNAISGFRDILCSYRQCNVGECRLPQEDYIGSRQEQAGHLIKERWSQNELKKIDPMTPSFDFEGNAQRDYVYQHKFVFDIWTTYLCSLQDMYGVVEFLLQYPSQKSLDLILRSASHCECIDGFGGPYCNDCPNY